ncbi:MAG: polyprenyl synthetase family protein [Clostridia bacterium]|nr:polyprenyl synthetase family protein [Clostridia bacterium]
MQPIEILLKEAAQKTEAELEKQLSPQFSGDTVLAEAMRYAVLGGGKRIRAFLVLQFCRLAGGAEENALPFAAALEMVHAYSLVHDDLPCMDNDDMRRGKPSCHKAFGEANALLAGDTLLTQAFETIVSASDVPDRCAVLAVRALAQGAGALGMAGGQYYDLSDECASYEELRRLQSMKTGALIRTAALLGCYAASSEPDSTFMRDVLIYADRIGFAFQIVDDMLDVTGTEAELGKPIGSDAKNGKKTVLSYLSMEEAASLAQKCTEEAIAALQPYAGNETLCALAQYLLNRKM